MMAMIYFKSNEYDITNNYNDKVKMILRSRLSANIKYVVTTLVLYKRDSLIKLIMFTVAPLSKRSFIEEVVKCFTSASQCRTFNQNVLDC